MTEHRSLIVSLDGATWDVLAPLADDGRLPTIQRLRQSGAAETLESVCPPITAAAWFSFQTGTTPAHHGVFTFSHITDDGRETSTVDASTSSRPTLWEYLDAHGLESISVNLPGTYPATDVPGTTISGLLAPSYDTDDAVSPPSVRALVEEVSPDYGILDNPREEYDPHTDPTEYTAAMVANARSRSAVTRSLMSAYDDWDVTMMHIQATDVLQHPLWKYLDSDHSGYDDAMQEVVADFYEAVDETLDEVITHAREQASSLDIYIVSDHGFQGLETRLYMDRLLEETGYLVRNGDSTRSRLVSAALRTAQKLDAAGLRNYVLSKDQRVSLGHTINTGAVDWDASAAWGHGNLYGYVYLLDERQRSDVAAAIERRADELVESVVDLNSETDNLHPEAPDLVVVPSCGVSIETLHDTDGPISAVVDPDSDFHIGGHDTDGIFVMDGPDVKPAPSPRQPELIDIMPTVLHRHGIGVPADVDGSALVELFDDADDTETITPLSNRTATGTTGGAVRDDVQERLRNLGYTE